jgi:pectin methylesterase-like acyl-CoA thioesterase
VTGKRGVTLRGADAASTVISYPNNEQLNPGTAQRAMVTALSSDDLVIERLTLQNTTPQGGSQAEALRVRGNRVILRDSRFLSLQDTLLLDGLVYVADSYVEGNVDFVWGYGTAYFERSEIKVVGRPGVIVQARNDQNGRGYFFVDSRLTSDPGLGNTTLARIDASEYPDSEVAFVNCQMGSHITAQGWTVTGDTAGPNLRFLEFQSTDLSGQLLNVSQRHPASRQLSANEAAALRDKPSVLGGWDPDG